MWAQVIARTGPLGPDSLCFGEVPVPEPGPGEVLVRVLSCGVCRTDLHVIEGDLHPQGNGRIPGHEVVGEVVRPGPGGVHRTGDRVGVAWLYRSCGRCPYCLRGQENLCADPLFTGYHRDGGYAEYMVADEAFCYPLPPDGDPVRQAPLLCAGLIGYRAYSQAALGSGQTLGLWGFGASAHLVLKLARSEGVRVFVVTRGHHHREWAREAGAFWVGESGFSVPPEYMDAAILFAPAGEIIPSIMACLDRGGTLLTAGIHVSDIPGMNYQKALFFEKHLRSVTANTREDGRNWLAIALERAIEPEVSTYPLVRAGEALADLKGDRLKGVAVLTMEKIGG